MFNQKGNDYIGIRSFLSSFARCIVLAKHRIIRVVGSWDTEDGRTIVVVVVTVFVDDVDDG